MRLHHLTVTAFGPFAGTVELDLEDLSGSGLYLVHGPTGSGKTSLLDAICFALYAHVPGDRLTTSLRSQHAAVTGPTTVVLELTLGGRRLRITRSPAYERAKKRGTGTTTEQAHVQLDEHRDGAWQSVSSRIDETAQVLDHLLGMGLDQFRRVVMLPQGDFAAFLRASDEERREVLERLFDVTDYVAVEEHLAAQRQQAQTTLAAARSSLEGHTSRMSELLAETDAELPPLEEPLDHLRPGHLRRAVDDIDAALGTHADEIMTLVDDARGRARRSRAALDGARQEEDHRQRGHRARAVLELLAGAGPEHADRRHRLSRATAAATVLPHLEAVRRARAAATAAVADGEAALAVLGGGTDRDPDALRGELTDQDDLLSAARHEADRLVRLERELTHSQSSLAACDDAATTAGQARAAARVQLEQIEEAGQQVEQAAHRLAVLTPLLAHLGELTTTRASITDLADRARETTDRRQAAHERVLACRERVQRLVQERLDDMAGELAGQLVDGEACAVCGASEHPDPARAAHHVGAEQIETAREEVAVAEEALERARSLDQSTSSRVELAHARAADLERLVAQSGREVLPGLDLEDDLSEHLDALARESDALGEVVARREAVDEAAAGRAAALERATATHEAATTDLAAARTRHEQLDDELVDGRRRLGAVLAQHATTCPCARWTSARDDEVPTDALATSAVARVGTAVRDHRAVLTAVDRVITTRDAVERMGAACHESEERLAVALAETGFEDPDEVTSALVGPEDRSELERLVEEHEARRSAATAVLEEDDVVVALRCEPADLDALTAAAEGAHAQAESLSRRQASAETVRRQFTTVRDHVHRACAELGPAADHAALVTRMATLVTGTSSDNDKRMRLSTFVLAARLERIVELANERLTDMADGRYELGHDDAGARGQRRGGLGLVVSDLWTGRVRPTSSLSGGEAFTASLALALGLADAIREESGGQEFGTLFVDEGFGSLDQDSLEQVLDVLDGLRDGGRTVGVVSHVAEMRTRIPTQVRVHKTQHGSSVTVVGTATSDVA